MGRVSERIDRLEVVFDDESLVADGGLLAAGTLFDRLGLEELWDEMLRLGGRVGGANPGRKVLSLVSSMLVGGTHIDHADRLRAGATAGVLPHRVMAPSTLGTFLRSFGRDDIGLWSSPHVLDTWFMRPCDGSSCPPIRLVAVVRWWNGAGGGCTRLRSTRIDRRAWWRLR